ncbi:MAG: NAD(P)/FAD-dependent oxidoreductase [Candidatus Desantisbacteria bacterium]
MNKKNIIVIGGGPAGMMAAIRAGQLGQDVTLIEKNPTPGKKLLLTGKGRCNITNNCDLETLIGKFHKNGRFLRTAFNTFSNTDVMQFFEDRGLSLKTERQLRVFPVTDTAGSVLEILKKELTENNVKILYNAQVEDILVQDNQVKGLLLRDKKEILCDRIILATGGISYGFTGSTGEGLRIAQRLGHHITPLRGGLVPLKTREHYPKLLEGLTLKNIQATFIGQTHRSAPTINDGKRQIVSEVGELLFTGFGISGPLILSLSGQIIDWMNEGKTVFVIIDLKPGMSYEQVDARFQREFSVNPKKNIRSILKFFLPQRMVDVFIEIAGIGRDKQVSQINKDERHRLVVLFKGLQLEITETLPVEQAMITRGGISLKEINPQTMESCIIKGLYFAGEMIDVDADTGGFNLQASFSTGYLAGENAAR